MADKESASRGKRRLKNAETIRERALKAQEAAEVAKPGIVSRGAGTVARPLRGLARIFRYQPFRFIAKVFRFIGRLIFPRYLRNSWGELRLVTWPSGKQTRQLVLAVIMFAFVFGALVSVVDYSLDKLFKEVLLK